MSSRAITIAGFVLIGLAGIVLELMGRSRRTTMPTLMRWVDFLRTLRYGQLVVLFVWWWLGWHFLAR